MWGSPVNPIENAPAAPAAEGADLAVTRRRMALDGPDQTMFIVVCGLPGTGKSTVAEGIADRLDVEHLRTDVVRKEIVEDPEYTDEEKRRVYEALLERARAEAAAGRDVVLDGTFSRATYRDRVRRLADEERVDCRFLKVECEPAIVEERIRQRSDDHSEADVDVYELYRDRFEPLDVAHATVDNSGAIEASVDRAMGHIDRPRRRADGR